MIVGNFSLSPCTMEYIFGSAMPWYFHVASSSNKFPFMAHVVVSRDGDRAPLISGGNSPLYEEISEAADRFCDEWDIPLNKILRCSINSVFANPAYPQSDPHVDYTTPHKVLLFYLNDSIGDTIIYKEKCVDANKDVFYLEDKPQLTIAHRITPKAGKAVCFDGAHYHANEWPESHERRVVCVVCFN